MAANGIFDGADDILDAGNDILNGRAGRQEQEARERDRRATVRLEWTEDTPFGKRGEVTLATSDEASLFVQNGKARVQDNPQKTADLKLSGKEGRKRRKKESKRLKSFGQFISLVKHRQTEALALHFDSHLVGGSTRDMDSGRPVPSEQKAAMAESGGATGGYTVPVRMERRVMLLAQEQSVMRPRCLVLPMSSGTLQVPVLDTSTVQSAGTSPFFGGLKLNWTQESATRTETEPTLRSMELRAWELSGTVIISNALLADGFEGRPGEAAGAILESIFAQSVAYYEDAAFLAGLGVGQPQGILAAPCTLTVTRAQSGQVQYLDVASMLSRLVPGALTRAVWVTHPLTLPQLLQLKDGAGRAVYLSPGEGGGVNYYLAGLPLLVSEKVPALGTKGDLLLIDPLGYCIGDRTYPDGSSILISASGHVKYTQFQTVFRIVKRVDGQPRVDKAITLSDGSTTVSPFVVLV